LSVLESQAQHTAAARALSALDLSSIEGLEGERLALDAQIKAVKDQRDEEMKHVGAAEKELGDLQRREQTLEQRLPELEIACANATAWATRFASAVPQLATEPQLVADARALASEAETTVDALRHRMQSLRENLPRTMRELQQAVGT